MTIVLNGTSGITTPPVSVEGSTSGTITLAAPAVAGTNTQTLVAATGTLAPLIAGTAVASTSGTSIDFTGIPSWVKRITVMFNGVSISGTSIIQIQTGAGSVTTSGYIVSSGRFFSSNQAFVDAVTTGFTLNASAATLAFYGQLVFTNISGNTWVASGTFSNSVTTPIIVSVAGSITLGGTLDRVRITTVNGTDTFDAGSINILYE